MSTPVARTRQLSAIKIIFGLLMVRRVSVGPLQMASQVLLASGKRRATIQSLKAQGLVFA